MDSSSTTLDNSVKIVSQSQSRSTLAEGSLTARVMGTSGRATRANGRVAGDDARVVEADGRVVVAKGRMAGSNGREMWAGSRVLGADGRVTGTSGRVTGADGRVTGAIRLAFSRLSDDSIRPHKLADYHCLVLLDSSQTVF